MIHRAVKPEILDSLDHDDPDAVRSRKDLVMINALMRGHDWIINQLKKQKEIARVVELGAGDGSLVLRIKKELPHLEVTALDLAPRPQGLDENIAWVQGDVVEAEVAYDRQTVIISNLFLHHFENDQLVKLAESWRSAGYFLFAEPYRSSFFSKTSRLLFPLINRITRHDMVVSIKAGFRRGELPALFSSDVEWAESQSIFGGLRSKGVQL